MSNPTNYQPHNPNEPAVFTYWGEPIEIVTPEDLVEAVRGATYGGDEEQPAATPAEPAEPAD